MSTAGRNVGFWFEEVLARKYNWKLNPNRQQDGREAGDLQTREGLEVQAKFGKASILPARPLEGLSNDQILEVLAESIQALKFDILSLGFVYRNKLFIYHFSKQASIQLFTAHTDLWYLATNTNNGKLKFRLTNNRSQSDLLFRRNCESYEIVKLQDLE